MHPTRFLPLAALAIVAAASPAQADVISGSFAGIATSGSFLTGPGTPPNVAGSTVTGAFDLASVATARQVDGSGGAVTYTLAPGALSYSFSIATINQTYSFGNVRGGVEAITLGDNGAAQSLQLNAGFADGHTTAYIDLVGPEGSLFSSTADLASLHAGPGATLQSPFSFGIYGSGFATVDVTSVSFTPQPVPEPAAWAVLAAALPLALRTAMPRRRHELVGKEAP